MDNNNNLPKIDVATLLDLDFSERAEVILSHFHTDLGDKVSATLTKNFEDADPTPVLKVDENLFLLELFHGQALCCSDLYIEGVDKTLCEATAYFSAYADILMCGEIKENEAINFAVPSEWAAAGRLAQNMGLNIDTLICADDAPCVAKTIEDFFDEYDYLLAPDAAKAVAKLKLPALPTKPTVLILPTHPYLHASEVFEAVMGVEEPDNKKAAEELADISALEVPAQLKGEQKK